MAAGVDGARMLAQVVAAAMPAPTTDTHVATVERIDENGTPWVRLAGAGQETPANGGTLVEVQPGQTVMARLAGGQLTLVGSTSAPSVSAQHVSAAVAPAMDKAIDAEDHAQRAYEAAEAAEADAKRAHDAADDAQSSAIRANTHAADALAQLTVVQDVAGTLDWIARHGTYVATTDTTVQPSTVYFELQDGDYVPVAEPSGSPAEHGWYVLDVADSQTDYIMAHLAVTSAGLWVLPAGMGQAQAPQGAPGYKLLLASNGVYLYDASGHLVTTYGESITFDSSRPQYIGGEDAYIAFYDSDGDGVPDSIRIGGSKVTIGGQSLSTVLADVARAKADAADAVRTAEDVPIVTLSSTNGTVFKRNLGISTTIIATIFTPGGRIANATGLQARFGAGAYLQWGWRDVVTDADHVLPSDDPRISQGGFALTVTPADVDTQAVITCSLNY